MKSITLTIIAAAMVSACAITPDQGSTMQLERSLQAVPVTSVSDTRRWLAPTDEFQIYENPDLHLAAVDQQLGTSG